MYRSRVSIYFRAINISDRLKWNTAISIWRKSLQLFQFQRLVTWTFTRHLMNLWIPVSYNGASLPSKKLSQCNEWYSWRKWLNFGLLFWVLPRFQIPDIDFPRQMKRMQPINAARGEKTAVFGQRRVYEVLTWTILPA